MATAEAVAIKQEEASRRLAEAMENIHASVDKVHRILTEGPGVELAGELKQGFDFEAAFAALNARLDSLEAKVDAQAEAQAEAKPETPKSKGGK